MVKKKIPHKNIDSAPNADGRNQSRKRKTEKVTGHEIARHAGVGYATVMRALSGNPKYYVSDQMRERVQEAARELGYTPNPFARALGVKRSYIIGLCAQGTSGKMDQTTDDNVVRIHVDHRLLGIQKNPLSRQYHIMVMLRNDNDRDLESYIMRGVQYLDGLIYVSPHKRQTKLLQDLAKRLPVVVEQGFGLKGLCTVSVDQQRATEESVTLLHKRGCRNLGLVLNLNPGYIHNEIRIKAFRETISTLGMSLNEKQIISCQGEDAVYQSIREMLKGESRMDGVIVPRDQELIGAVNAIRDAGLGLGQDVRLISVNETDTARNIQPGITAIRFPIIDLANQCFKLLMQQIDENLETKPHMLIPATLIERESTRGS